MIVLEKFEIRSRKSYHQCKCDSCGEEFKRRSDYNSFVLCIKCANVSAGEKRATHGENNRNSRLHVTWNNMLNRCRNKNNARFDFYGARGISVCDDWLDYKLFSIWARSNGYSDELTIDRIDNDKGYRPDNCRFVDKSYQNANRGKSCKNKSGFVGVWFERGAFCSRVQFKGIINNLGRFKSMSDAVLARDAFIRDNDLPNQLSGIENYTIDDLKEIIQTYKGKCKELEL